jgi:hypothetical protein
MNRFNLTNFYFIAKLKTRKKKVLGGMSRLLLSHLCLISVRVSVEKFETLSQILLYLSTVLTFLYFRRCTL